MPFIYICEKEASARVLHIGSSYSTLIPQFGIWIGFYRHQLREKAKQIFKCKTGAENTNLKIRSTLV